MRNVLLLVLCALLSGCYIHRFKEETGPSLAEVREKGLGVRTIQKIVPICKVERGNGATARHANPFDNMSVRMEIYVQKRLHVDGKPVKSDQLAFGLHPAWELHDDPGRVGGPDSLCTQLLSPYFGTVLCLGIPLVNALLIEPFRSEVVSNDEPSLRPISPIGFSKYRLYDDSMEQVKDYSVAYGTVVFEADRDGVVFIPARTVQSRQIELVFRPRATALSAEPGLDAYSGKIVWADTTLPIYNDGESNESDDDDDEDSVIDSLMDGDVGGAAVNLLGDIIEETVDDAIDGKDHKKRKKRKK